MEEIAYGYCHCGCGQKTKINTANNSPRGWIKGEPRRFLKGHQSTKLYIPEYIINDNGCWIWQKAKADTGYGTITVNGKTKLAHRVYYEKYKGKIPNGLEIDHLCRNRNCVNPDHLEAVKREINIRRGSQSKFTDEEIEAVRLCWTTNKFTVIELAKIFKMSRNQVYGVIRYLWRKPLDCQGD